MIDIVTELTRITVEQASALSAAVTLIASHCIAHLAVAEYRDRRNQTVEETTT